MTTNTNDMTPDGLLEFAGLKLEPAKPDALTLARNRLARAEAELARCEAWHDEDWKAAYPAMRLAQREEIVARREVAKLETERLKGAK